MPDFAHSLSPEQITRFAALWADACVSIDEIAAAFGVQRGTVYRVAAAFGLPPNPERRKVQGRKGQAKMMAIRAVLDNLGREPSTTCYVPPPAALHALPARPRPGDRPGERWIQLR